MGSCGSGRNHRWASRTDEFHKLDLADFARGAFERWRSGSITWSRGDHVTASIGYSLAPDHMRLRYTNIRHGERTPINERFEFSFTAQAFGGVRRWIVCPSCQRRCRVLYGGRHYRCRTCYRATYESQYERIRVPGLASAERVRHRLGAQPGFIHPFPDKPKGMHWRTYRRLQEQDWAATEKLEAALAGRMTMIRRKAEG